MVKFLYGGNETLSGKIILHGERTKLTYYSCGEGCSTRIWVVKLMVVVVSIARLAPIWQDETKCTPNRRCESTGPNNLLVSIGAIMVRINI